MLLSNCTTSAWTPNSDVPPEIINWGRSRLTRGEQRVVNWSGKAAPTAWWPTDFLVTSVDCRCRFGRSPKAYMSGQRPFILKSRLNLSSEDRQRFVAGNPHYKTAKGKFAWLCAVYDTLIVDQGTFTTTGGHGTPGLIADATEGVWRTR